MVRCERSWPLPSWPLPASAYAPPTAPPPPKSSAPSKYQTTSPPCGRARAHSRGGTWTQGVVLGVQQTLDVILQNLVLCLSRQTRSGARASTADALHLGWRALNRRQREGRRTQWPDEACGRRSRGVHWTAENTVWVASSTSRVLVVVLREDGSFRCY
jgi:hypothetical protein